QERLQNQPNRLTLAEIDRLRAIDERLQAYDFYGKVRAMDSLTHGKALIPSVLQVPSIHEKLMKGDLSFAHMGKMAEIAEKTDDSKILQKKLDHFLRTSTSPAADSTIPTPPATSPNQIKIPTLAEYQAANAAITSARTAFIVDMAEKEYLRLQHDPLFDPIDTPYHEVLDAVQKRYGNVSYEQLAAIQARQPVRLVPGGPGTGKTSTAIGMIEAASARQERDLSKTFVTSPTNAPLAVLSQRIPGIQVFHPEVDFQRDLQYRTLYSKALSDLAKVDEETGESPLSTLLGTKHARLLGAGEIRNDISQTVEQAVAKAGEGQQAYVNQFLKDMGLKNRVRAGDLLAHITQVKGEEEEEAFQR